MNLKRKIVSHVTAALIPLSPMAGSLLLAIRVEHDSEGWSEGSGWQVFKELCSHEAAVTVGLVDGSPHGSKFSVFL